MGKAAQTVGILIENEFYKIPRSLGKFVGFLHRNVNLGIKKSATKIQKDATGMHRFTTRSGMAERSVQTAFENLKGVIYLDDGIANYSKFLHNGFKSWSKDPFLKNAFYANLMIITANMENAITQSKIEAGL